jgi:hypothetical protein
LAGSLKGKIVVDTTNPYGASTLIVFADGVATGERNQRKVPGARVVKAFNTYTASFKAAARENPGQTAMFISGADAEAKQIVGGLVEAVGFEPADLGGWKTALLTDAPGRNGAVDEKPTHPPMRGKSPAWLLGTLPQLMHLTTKLRSNVRLEVTSSAHTDGCDEFKPRNCYISGAWSTDENERRMVCINIPPMQTNSRDETKSRFRFCNNPRG